MNRKVISILLITLLAFSIMAFSACGTQQRPGPTNPNTPAPNTPAPSTPIGPADDNKQADRIAESITKMEEINSATVVLAENRAWVGVDLKAQSTNEVTDNVKEEITRMVKSADSSIDTVYVTADADTVTRLRNMARDIGEGRPVSGFMNQLEQIAKRVAPSMQ